MKAVDDLIRFDYSPMFNFFLDETGQVDKKAFQDEVWVHVEFLRGNDGFSRSFHWDDEDVIVSIEAEFERV